jgi:hypothetical protein
MPRLDKKRRVEINPLRKEDTAVKVISKVCFILLVIGSLNACAKKDEIVKGTCQGVYDMSHTMQEMEHPDGPAPLDREYPSYDQYEREREEMLGGADKKPQ